MICGLLFTSFVTCIELVHKKDFAACLVQNVCTVPLVLCLLVQYNNLFRCLLVLPWPRQVTLNNYQLELFPVLTALCHTKVKFHHY